MKRIPFGGLKPVGVAGVVPCNSNPTTASMTMKRIPFGGLKLSVAVAVGVSIGGG
jgi:hypothetical protein